jgi:hypothetical protein
MLLKAALLLLVAWLLGVVGIYNVGPLVHVLLLVGLMVLLLAVARGLQAPAGRGTGSPPDKR